MIYHITTQSQWQAASQTGHYAADSLQSEGFIHCSKQNQVQRSARNYFSGVPDLLLLCIEEAKLSADLRWENTSGGTELFPHLYGPLNLDAVSQSRPLSIEPEIPT